jgi:hypothetical protein
VGRRTGTNVGRGLNGHLTRNSTEDLACALRCAESTLEQVTQFISQVEAELTARGHHDHPPAA